MRLLSSTLNRTFGLPPTATHESTKQSGGIRNPALRNSPRSALATFTRPGRLPVWILTGLLAAFAPGPASAAETSLVVIGVTEPIIDVTLGSPVPGIIQAQNFKEGDAVKAGQAIIELDKKIEELEVERRKQVLALRKMELESTQVLFEKTTSIPKEELDKKRIDYNVAVAELQIAQEQLRRRLIMAPHDGIVTDVLLHVGEVVDEYKPVVRMVDPRQCRFECNLEARGAARLTLNQSVRLEVDTGAAPQAVTGTVAFISPVADPASGLINVKVLFKNPNGTLRPGLPGRMLIVD